MRPSALAKGLSFPNTKFAATRVRLLQGAPKRQRSTRHTPRELPDPQRKPTRASATQNCHQADGTRRRKRQAAHPERQQPNGQTCYKGPSGRRRPEEGVGGRQEQEQTVWAAATQRKRSHKSKHTQGPEKAHRSKAQKDLLKRPRMQVGIRGAGRREHKSPRRPKTEQAPGDARHKSRTPGTEKSSLPEAGRHQWRGKAASCSRAVCVAPKCNPGGGSKRARGKREAPSSEKSSATGAQSPTTGAPNRRGRWPAKPNLNPK